MISLFKKHSYLIITLLSIAVIGALNFVVPFMGDQAFFLNTSKEISQGAILYQDHWDIKQPGIFIFYLIAGNLFGFTEFGIHFFELLYWLLFSAIFIWFLKSYIYQSSGKLPYIIGFLLAGTYFALGWVLELSQVEGLVLFPLMMVIIFNTLYLKRDKRKLLWLLLSGLAGGIVLYYKMIFLPILGLFWLVTFIRSYLKTKLFIATLFHFLIIPVGALLCWVPFLIYCHVHNISQLVFNTFFVYPPQLLKEATIPYGRLMHAIFTFLPRIALLLPLAVYGAYKWRKNAFALDMIIWCAIAVIIIIMQRRSCYRYHLQLFYPPIVVLAVSGGIEFLKKNRTYRIKSFGNIKKLYILLLIINLPALGLIGFKLFKLAEHNFALSPENRMSYILSNPSNKTSFEIVRLIKSNLSDSCTIYGTFNPLIYHYADKSEITVLSGYTMMLPSQWKELLKELQQKRPCYIFVDEKHLVAPGIFLESFLSWINSDYELFKTCNEGKWYSLHGHSHK